MDTGLLKVALMQGSQPTDQSRTQGVQPAQDFLRAELSPCRPCWIILRLVSRQGWSRLRNNPLQSLHKYLVVSGKVGQMFPRRPFARGRRLGECIQGFPLQEFGQEIPQLRLTTVDTGQVRLTHNTEITRLEMGRAGGAGYKGAIFS